MLCEHNEIKTDFNDETWQPLHTLYEAIKSNTCSQLSQKLAQIDSVQTKHYLQHYARPYHALTLAVIHKNIDLLTALLEYTDQTDDKNKCFLIFIVPRNDDFT